MRRPDFRWEIESEVEFPSPAFCQVEGVPDGFLKIGFRDGNLQAQYFYRRAFLDGVIGFVQLFFCSHGFCVLVVRAVKMQKQVPFVHQVFTPYGGKIENVLDGSRQRPEKDTGFATETQRRREGKMK